MRRTCGPEAGQEAVRATRATAESSLVAEDITVYYHRAPVLVGLSVQIPRTKITALVGPNGSGKSTLLRTLARLLRPTKGAVYLDGAAIHRLPTAAVARQLAVLPQSPSVTVGLTVRELVEMGRFAYTGFLGGFRSCDREAVARALRLVSMERYEHRRLDELSGGERQRAWIAMAIAQATPVLLLDEPTTHLDLGHQLEVLELLRHLNRHEGLTVVLVLHDLNQAARYSDHMVVMHSGRIVAQGPPAEVLTPQLCMEVFRVQAFILQDSAFGVPVCIPYAAVGTSTSGIFHSAAARP